jgi:hypothetical protein
MTPWAEHKHFDDTNFSKVIKFGWGIKSSGRPSSSWIYEIRTEWGQVIHEERRRTINDVFNFIGLPNYTFWWIVTEDLTMRWIATNFLPRLLNDDQK